MAHRHPSFSCPVTSTEGGEAEREGEWGIFLLFKLVINKHLQAINTLTVSAFFGENYMFDHNNNGQEHRRHFFPFHTENNDHL